MSLFLHGFTNIFLPLSSISPVIILTEISFKFLLRTVTNLLSASAFRHIFIPYCEIGISCLTKEVTEINLFFETILKLIDIDVSDVHEISSIMGIEIYVCIITF